MPLSHFLIKGGGQTTKQATYNSVYILHGLLSSKEKFLRFATELNNKISMQTHADNIVLHDTLSRGLVAAPNKSIVKANNIDPFFLVLVDLPDHGENISINNKSYNKDRKCNSESLLSQYASQLQELSKHLSKDMNILPPKAVIGHSLGGKIALEYLEQIVNNKNDNQVPPPSLTVLLDASPSKNIPTPNKRVKYEKTVKSIIEDMKNVNYPIKSKMPLFNSLIEKNGHSKLVAQWAVGSLKPYNTSNGFEGYVWPYDDKLLLCLLEEHLQKDYWSFLRGSRMSNPVEWKGESVFVVRAERNSTLWTDAHLSQFPQFGGPPAPCVQTEILANARHWMYSDRLHELVAMLAPKVTSAIVNN